MISQHWFRKWLGAVRQQAITWANVDPDLCRHMVSLDHNELTHWGLSAPSHYLNQCSHIVNWALRNIFQCNFICNSKVFIQGNALENGICKMVAESSRPKCVNSSPPSATYMHQWISSALIQIMVCRLFGAKPLSEPMLPYCQLDAKEHSSVKFYLKFKSFQSRKCTWKWCLQNSGSIVSTSVC